MTDKKEHIELKSEGEIKKAFLALIDLCPICDKAENRNSLINACNFAYEAHKGMRRKSGEPFIFHPIEVAKIVAKDIGLGLTSMICALLHDVIEDVEEITEDVIKKEFGEKIAYVVNGLTKITNVDPNKEQAATFRKMLISLSEDLRVILIKIADRLHNMRTLADLPENRQIVKAGETLYVYAPLARKLGLNKIGRELEDLSFKYHLPEEYKKLMTLIEADKIKRESVLTEFKNKVAQVLDKDNIDYEIKVVRKSLYATWQKMTKEQLAFEDIHNFQTLRLIFKPEPSKPERLQCYHVYAQVTGIFTARRGSLQDMVANPRANGFEALIVDVMLSDGNWKEVQILSQRMGEIAERGYSSEKKIGSTQQQSERDKWIQSIGDQIVNLKQDDSDFIDNFKLNLYISEIYIFTPKGDMITLPKGASVLDFAFQIHTDLGLHCVGAKVNKKITNPTHILESGDQVEVLSSNRVLPQEEWLKYVFSAKAKQFLLAYFNKQKTQKLAIGKKRLDDILSSLKTELTTVSSGKLQKYFACDSMQQLYLKIENKLITRAALTKAVKSISPTNNIISNVINSIWNNNTENNNIETEKLKFTHKKFFVLDENTNTSKCVISNCCLPIPGDESIAYCNTEGKIFIHRSACREMVKLNAKYGKSVAKVKWNPHTKSSYKAKLFIEGLDRKNMVHDLTYVISDQMHVNMNAINIKEDNGIFKGKISVYVPNLDVLKALIIKLKKVKGINLVGRESI